MFVEFIKNFDDTPITIARTNAKQIKKFLKFYGMSSKEAMDKYHGGIAHYRASEGKCIKVPYKGTVEEVISDICGGIRSGCSYIGATRLKDFSKRTTFVRMR